MNNSLHVNQLGYLVNGPKYATLDCDSLEPVEWQLADLSGLTTPRGFDATTGRVEHVIDFADFQPESENVLAAGRQFLTAGANSGCVTAQVIIAPHIYDQVLLDALRVFTLQRSGYPIGPEIAGSQYARPAGHLNIAPNQGDIGITPLPVGGATDSEGIDLYDGWSGDYQIDASGGWYDAGDAGKYVVNGGISVAQLLGVVEQALRFGQTGAHLRPGAPAQVAQSLPAPLRQAATLALSEALWELDWMARMQVAAGLPYSGMVHHKVSDLHWTKIPILPADDPQPRYVHRPSTAATLNFAAVAGQASRVLARLIATGSPLLTAVGLTGTDAGALATKYLTAARTAWAAAMVTPNLFAPDTNTLPNPGSGPYNDTELDDEFYWAAVELYLATGEPEYLTALRANPYHLPNPGERVKSPWVGLPDQPAVGFDWRDTAAWARIQLALNGDGGGHCSVAGVTGLSEPTKLTDLTGLTELTELRADLVVNAHRLAAAAAPFGQLYHPASGRYNWGSNGMIANNAAIVAAAFEISGDPALRSAALAGLDYLFGRNVLDLSYVTGYGERYVHNQHSRWFAAAADPSLPHPPPGTLSGGPNSDCPDAPAAHLAGQPAQFCFVDDIASYGTNEMTINWNAALAYILAWVVGAGSVNAGSVNAGSVNAGSVNAKL